MKKWKINSWRNYPVKHIPKYEDEKDLNLVLNKLKSFPPLVFAGETRHLKDQLANVVDGKAFLLQGGDCAESFAEFNPDNIRDTFKVILQMALVMTYSASLPIVKVGRIAGQFSKPRSAPTEKKNGKEDILKRTLIIIDEVHKLYSNDTVISERPNIEVINKRIKDSYKISGKDSVKLLLMSATPMFDKPYELGLTFNLLPIKNKFPTGSLAILKSDLKDWSELKYNSFKVTDFVRPRFL